jgi:YD repeat-containing protein
VLGRWWSEGFEFVFRWRDGHLEARATEAPANRAPAVFAVESGDVLRTVSGREAGEQLRLTRDGAGRVVRMHWATYRLTRDQQTFGTP